MRAALLASAEQKAAFTNAIPALQTEWEWVWVDSIRELVQQSDCEVWVDLLFEHKPERLLMLQQNHGTVVVVNSVIHTLAETDLSFVRINAWPGFLQRDLIEAVAEQDDTRVKVADFFSQFGKKVVWTPDEPGFITARVIVMIINEAYLAWGEGVSSRSEIDTAMKLGTNYPMGPFEWAERIGTNNVYQLLKKRAEADEKYKPARLLEKEILS